MVGEPGLAPRQRGLGWLGSLVMLIVFYALAFPKGGVKVSDVPITFGYMLTAILALIAMMRAGTRLAVPSDRLLAFVPCILLALWSAIVIRANGANSVSYTVSYFVSVLYLPTFGLLAFSSLLLDEHHAQIERAFMWAVRFIVAYGIFLFLFKQLTGQWIEIPYLTINADDAGKLGDKYINRGGIFKLISTYNNGNIFGVSVVIMAPLYLRMETGKLFKIALYAALFLTLSRTAWIGAILIIVATTLSKGIRVTGLLYLIAGVAVAAASVAFLLYFLGFDVSFLLDSNLGGRASQLDVLNDVRVVPDQPTDVLPEIVYLGVLKDFGVPGLLLFVAHLLTPSLLLRMEGVRLLSPTKAAACLQGLLIYAVLAGSDAGYNFIPVMMIFWMVAGMGFWYARRRSSSKGVREAFG